MAKKTTVKNENVDNVDNVDNAGNPENTGEKEDTTALTIIDNVVQALGKLDEAKAEALMCVVDQMNPNKEGFESSEDEAATLPRVKIRQGMSADAPDDVKMGGLYTDAGDNLGASLDLIPLYMYKTNRRFESQENGVEACSSEDTVRSIYGDLCAQCEDMPFRDGKVTKCNKSMELIALSADYQHMYRVSFMKTSYRAGAQIYRQARAGKHAWDKTFRISTEPRTRAGTQGSYYIMTAQVSGDRAPESDYPVLSMFQQMIATQRKAYLESLKTMRRSQEEVLEAVAQIDGGGNGDQGGPAPDYKDL